LVQITLDMVRKYKANRLGHSISPKGTKEQPRKVQVSTVNRELAGLKTLLNYAVSERKISFNPCAGVRGLRSSEKGRNRKRALDTGEIARLLSVSDERMKKIFTLAFLTGMRAGEIMGLKWSSIDTRNWLIHLMDTKNGEAIDIVMSPVVRKVIVSVSKTPNSELLFPGRDKSKPLNIREPYQKAVDLAKLNDGVTDNRLKFVFHSTRHTFETGLRKLGIDRSTTKLILGHTTGDVTDGYTHIDYEFKLRQLMRLEEVFGFESAEKVESSGTKSGTVDSSLVPSYSE